MTERKCRSSNKCQKYQRISPITKQDKQHITKILEEASAWWQAPAWWQAFSTTNPDVPGWIESLQTINIDSMNRSMAHILNSNFDSIPQSLIDANQHLREIQ